MRGCFDNCVCFGNMCTCIYCVLYRLYCIFVLFRLCLFMLIYFVCTSVRTSATEWKLNYSNNNNNNNNNVSPRIETRSTSSITAWVIPVFTFNCNLCTFNLRGCSNYVGQPSPVQWRFQFSFCRNFPWKYFEIIWFSIFNSALIFRFVTKGESLREGEQISFKSCGGREKVLEGTEKLFDHLEVDIMPTVLF